MNESNSSANGVIEVFNEARARPAGAEREQFLAEACGADAALRAEVDELLGAREEAGSFLKPGAAVSAQLEAEFARLKPEEAGVRIGHYKLLEQIGQGGFGTVWVAEQEKPVRRRVALKIINLGMDTKEVIARFEQERQALAMMEHPNIAKVFDAGASELGRPYFVMELVRGIKITEYCDQANLSTADRLQLFIAVCQAVQHAHQKGIIHRDLKPSNILVTLHDGVPVPKVIDFGVAKATQQQRLTDLTVYTQFEQMVGTPLYMSPEQAEMSGLDVDTRSDIYSLGVLLYELLTGRTPFDPETLMRQGLDEIRRAIREQEPQKPSTFVQTMALELRTTVARHRQAEAAKLVGLIRGDLDWIVMKAIEKDRNRRYETATGLAKDIERHLNNEPVRARPPSRAYQFQKLVRRNQLAVAATAAVMAALMIGLGAATWMFFKERAARERAELAEGTQNQLRLKAEAEEQKAEEARANEATMRDRAEAEAARSSQVAQFLQEMLKGVGPAKARGRDTTLLREILEKTAKRLEELKDQPAVEADLRATLGTVYSDLGEYPAAAAMHEEALGLRRKLFGNEHPQVAASMHALANVLADQGQRLEGEAMHREALAMRIKLFGKSHVDVAESFSSLAMVLRHQGKKVEAESTARQAFEICVQLFGEEHSRVAEAVHILAWSVHELERHAEAEALSRGELAIWRKLRGDDHPNVGWALGDLTLYLRAQGKLQEAEAALREALEIGRKQSEGDPTAAATFLRQLGYVLRDQGRPAEAEGVWQEELAIRRKVSGNDHPEVASTLQALAYSLYDQRKFSEAETVLREALRIRRARLGDDHVEVAAAFNSLADVLQKSGQVAEVEALYREELARRKQRYGDHHRNVSDALLWVARFLHQQRRLTEAEVAFREVLAIERDLSPEGDPLIANAALDLAFVLWEMGRHAEAEPPVREGLEIRRETLGDDHAKTREAIALLALNLQALGKHPEVVALYRERLASRKKAYGKESAHAAESLADLASAFHKAGEIAEADTTFQEALSLCRKLPDSMTLTAEVLVKWGSFLWTQQRIAEAVTAYREEVELRRKLHGDIHRNVEEALAHLARSLESQARLDEAETVWREELVVERKLSGDEHPLVANSLFQLARVLTRAGRAAEAESVLRETLTIRRKSLGDEHLDSTVAMVSLGSNLRNQGKQAEAEDWFRKAVASDRHASREGGPNFAAHLSWLGVCLLDQAKYAEAEGPFREALDIWRKAGTQEPGPGTFAFDQLARALTPQNKSAELKALIEEELGHARAPDANGATAASPKLGLILHHAALALHGAKLFKEARPLAQEACTLYEQHPDWPEGEKSHAFQVLKAVLTELADPAAIETRLRESLPLSRTMADGSQWVALFDQLARALTAQNRSAELNALIQDELAHARTPDATGGTTATAKLGLNLHHAALALHSAKLFTEARPLAEEAWTLYERNPDWPENERQHALQVFTAVLSDLGDHAAIEPLQRKMIDRLRAKVPAKDAQLAGALAELTLHLLTQQKFSEAEAPACESLAIREKTAPDDWRTFNSRSMVGASLLGQKKYPEAEPLLLSGCEGMKQREKSIPAVGKMRLREALQRLGELYEARGEKEKAAEWKKKVAEFDEAGTTPIPAVSKQ